MDHVCALPNVVLWLLFTTNDFYTSCQIIQCCPSSIASPTVTLGRTQHWHWHLLSGASYCPFPSACTLGFQQHIEVLQKASHVWTPVSCTGVFPQCWEALPIIWLAQGFTPSLLASMSFSPQDSGSPLLALLHASIRNTCGFSTTLALSKWSHS